jgi:hypothetical protein
MSPAAVITEVEAPPGHGPIEWWPVYRDGDAAVVQNQCLAHRSQQVEGFSFEEPWHAIGPRFPLDAMLEEIAWLSEWHVPISAVVAFLERERHAVE